MFNWRISDLLKELLKLMRCGSDHNCQIWLNLVGANYEAEVVRMRGLKFQYLADPGRNDTPQMVVRLDVDKDSVPPNLFMFMNDLIKTLAIHGDLPVIFIDVLGRFVGVNRVYESYNNTRIYISSDQAGLNAR